MKTRLLFLIPITIAAIALAVTFITSSKNSDGTKNRPDKSSKIEQNKSKASMRDDKTPNVMPVTTHSTLDQMIKSGLTEKLGRDVSFKETYKRTNDNWVIICGKPTEISGMPFNYERSPLKEMMEEKLMEDKFCQLAKKSDQGFMLIENDIGSLDSPILSWLYDHNIPMDLIK